MPDHVSAHRRHNGAAAGGTGRLLASLPPIARAAGPHRRGWRRPRCCAAGPAVPVGCAGLGRRGRGAAAGPGHGRRRHAPWWIPATSCGPTPRTRRAPSTPGPSAWPRIGPGHGRSSPASATVSAGRPASLTSAVRPLPAATGSACPVGATVLDGRLGHDVPTVLIVVEHVARWGRRGDDRGGVPAGAVRRPGHHRRRHRPRARRHPARAVRRRRATSPSSTSARRCCGRPAWPGCRCS